MDIEFVGNSEYEFLFKAFKAGIFLSDFSLNRCDYAYDNIKPAVKEKVFRNIFNRICYFDVWYGVDVLINGAISA